MVYSTSPAKGKLAQLSYKVIRENANFSQLEVTLITGRKNQIRVQMADKGHPVVGDRKYGNDDHQQLALHSKSIAFKHPVNGEPVSANVPIPAFFKQLMVGQKSKPARHWRRLSD